MKKAEQRSNLHRISLRMKYPGEGKNLEDLQLRKSVFPTNHPNALIRNSVSDQGPNATVDCGLSSSRSRRGSDGPVDAKVSKSPFAQDPDEKCDDCGRRKGFHDIVQTPRLLGWTRDRNLLKIQVKVRTPQALSGHRLWKSEFV
jgi:hypothetical protein